jgi:hypothetical protein
MTVNTDKTAKQIRASEYGKSRRMNPAYKKEAAERTKRWREANTDKSRASTAAWQKANPARTAEYAQRRYATQKQAARAWVDVDMQQRILDMYKVAAELTSSSGVKFHVDHIVPLRGIVVCGLHVWWNLQVIVDADNQKKSSKFEPAIYPEQGKLAFT